WKARRDTLKKSGGHYPAPLAALDAVRAGFRSRRTGYQVESRKFADLAVTDVSRRLVQIFFATTALKKDDPGAPAPAKIGRLGVIGSGFMGAGIAGTAVSAAQLDVRLRDTELARVGRGLKAADDILAGRLKRRRIPRQEYQRLTSLLSGTTDFTGFQRANLV